jgi:hypothetical protein
MVKAGAPLCFPRDKAEASPKPMHLALRLAAA